jgi:hypothetical protein
VTSNAALICLSPAICLCSAIIDSTQISTDLKSDAILNRLSAHPRRI